MLYLAYSGCTPLFFLHGPQLSVRRLTVQNKGKRSIRKTGEVRKIRYISVIASQPQELGRFSVLGLRQASIAASLGTHLPMVQIEAQIPCF